MSSISRKYHSEEDYEEWLRENFEEVLDRSERDFSISFSDFKEEIGRGRTPDVVIAGLVYRKYGGLEGVKQQKIAEVFEVTDASIRSFLKDISEHDRGDQFDIVNEPPKSPDL